MALLQQYDTRQDILIEPAARRRAAIEARGHSELGAFRTGGVRNWGAQSGCKNQPACYCCWWHVCRPTTVAMMRNAWIKWRRFTTTCSCRRFTPTMSRAATRVCWLWLTGAVEQCRGRCSALMHARFTNDRNNKLCIAFGGGSYGDCLWHYYFYYCCCFRIVLMIIIIINQATGYASQHIWCLSQTRINWEACRRKGIWRKNGGMREVGRWLVRLEWRQPDCWCVCLWYLSLHHKVQKKLSCGTGSPG